MLVNSYDPFHIVFAEDLDVLGYCPQEIVGKSIFILVGPETDRELLHQAIINAGVHSCASKFSLVMYDRSGHGRHVTVTCEYENVEYDSTSYCRLTIELSDVLLLSSVYEETLHAWALVSAEWPHVVETVNDRFILQFGLPAQAIVGQNLHRIKPPRTQSEPWRQAFATASMGRRSVQHVVACCASGAEMQMELLCIPVVSSRSSPVDRIMAILSALAIHQDAHAQIQPYTGAASATPAPHSSLVHSMGAASASPPTAARPRPRSLADHVPEPPAVLDDGYVRRVRRRHLTAERRAAAAAARECAPSLRLYGFGEA